MSQIVIIGGGLAGMAAAAALAGCRATVTLLESRPRLGGRASSFVDHTTGTVIDNCQHINLGCCTNFQHFCQMAGIADGLRTDPVITFIGPNLRPHALRSSWLPAPLHLFPSFARLSYLSWYDKWRLAWGLRALAHRRQATSNELMSDWLKRHRQTPHAIQRVWQVVLVSALSESLDRITVRDARKVFVDAFLANRHGWELQVPVQPLDTLYTQRVGTWLRDHGVDVQLGAGVKQVIVESNHATGVELRDGQVIRADEIVLAVPAFAVPTLLPMLGQHPIVQSLEQLEWSPISSVHLWFDRPIMSLPHATLVDRLSQWVFSRGPVTQSDGSTAESYQVVISASRQLEGRDQAEIIHDILSELTAVWPATGTARLINARVVTEHKACLSMLPRNDSLRPTARSPLANLWFAGDWTATGWPSTMEGAVRSGFSAAEHVMQHLGHPHHLVQPDLPIARLSRILLGI